MFVDVDIFKLSGSFKQSTFAYYFQYLTDTFISIGILYSGSWWSNQCTRLPFAYKCMFFLTYQDILFIPQNILRHARVFFNRTKTNSFPTYVQTSLDKKIWIFLNRKKRTFLERLQKKTFAKNNRSEEKTFVEIQSLFLVFPLETVSCFSSLWLRSRVTSSCNQVLHLKSLVNCPH